MAVKIRLARGGTKKRPHYSIVVSDSRAARDSGYIEKVGTYNPMLPKDAAGRVVLKTERVQHWLGQGAQPTDRTALFLSQAGLIEAPKRTEKTKQGLPKKKAQERIREKEALAEKAAEAAAAKAAEAEAAKNAPTPEPEPATEAPAEEAAAEAPAETASTEDSAA